MTERGRITGELVSNLRSKSTNPDLVTPDTKIGEMGVNDDGLEIVKLSVQAQMSGDPDWPTNWLQLTIKELVDILSPE